MDLNRQLERSDVWSLEEDDSMFLIKPVLSFDIWMLWKSTGYQAQLFGGRGILDWPEWLMNDITTLNMLNRIVRREQGYEDK